MRSGLKYFAVGFLLFSVAVDARGQEEFYAIQPCRVFDSRVDEHGPGGVITKDAYAPPSPEVAQHPIIADSNLKLPSEGGNLGTHKVDLDVASQCNLGDPGGTWTAKSIAYNLTATEPGGGAGVFSANGLVILYPLADDPPYISLLNFRAGVGVYGNGGIVALDPDGHLGVTVVSANSAANNGGTDAHVILDVTGYFR